MSDKKPIIKILFYKTKEAYFGLSADERKQLAIKTTKDVVDVGGRWLTRCDCYWADEEWSGSGSWSFQI